MQFCTTYTFLQSDFPLNEMQFGMLFSPIYAFSCMLSPGAYIFEHITWLGSCIAKFRKEFQRRVTVFWFIYVVLEGEHYVGLPSVANLIKFIPHSYLKVVIYWGKDPNLQSLQNQGTPLSVPSRGQGTWRRAS